MRTWSILLCLLPLAGCGWTGELAGTAAVGVNAASIAAIQRTPVDAVYSLWTGRDCSVVRLDEGKTYCRTIKPEPSRPPFCTRTLGVATCWKDPADLPDHPHGLADGPSKLTPQQEANRTRTWP